VLHVRPAGAGDGGHHEHPRLTDQLRVPRVELPTGRPGGVHPVADAPGVHAHKADRKGNLVFKETARNFNPEAAQCARVSVAQVEYLVDDLDPDEVHLPGIYVDRVVVVGPQEAGIENRTTRPAQTVEELS
jgi:hypothetical protein